MPDHRQHRGPHPEDERLFAGANVQKLREATHDLSWLLTRGYATTSAVKIVGDRFALDRRQRVAVARCACSESDIERRNRHQVTQDCLGNRELWIDGYNVLTSIEAALGGGVILHARDGCYRDMASMHGSYRRVEETKPALGLIGEAVEKWNLAACHWLLDRPVSNSGRLRTLITEVATQHGWSWSAEAVADPDSVLSDTRHVAASADSQILDKAERWCNLAKAIIDVRIPDAWMVDLSGSIV